MSSIKIIVCILVVTVSANLVVSEQTNTCADEEAYVALCQASDGQPNQEKRSNTKTAVKPSLKRSVKTSPTFAHECQSFVGKFCDGKATSVVNPTAAANPSISSSMATTGKPVGKVNGSQKQYLKPLVTMSDKNAITRWETFNGSIGADGRNMKNSTDHVMQQSFRQLKRYKRNIYHDMAVEAEAEPNADRSDSLEVSRPMNYGSNDFPMKGIIMPNCGKSHKLAQRVVGGKDAEEGAYPWIAAILKNGDGWCGGAILNEWWIITASHCFMASMDPKEYVVRVGTINRNVGATYKIEKLIMHERFHLDSMFNSDIALLKVERPIKMGDRVNGICLPTTSFEEPMTANLVITGWGVTKFQDKELPVILQEVTLPRISDGECVIKYQPRSQTIYKSQLCTWAQGKDACQGDSGGPAIEVQNSRAVLIGIVSYGAKCAGAIYCDKSIKTSKSNPKENIRDKTNVRITDKWFAESLHVVNSTADIITNIDGNGDADDKLLEAGFGVSKPKPWRRDDEEAIDRNVNAEIAIDLDTPADKPASEERKRDKYPALDLINAKGCGVQEIENMRIVNGKDAKPGAYPWIVSILRNGDPWCGGSIINNKWILTAAHCTTYKVDKIIVHERFHLDNMFNSDVALMRVNRAIKMSKLVKPVCVPTVAFEDAKTKTLLVVGWGQTSFENKDLPTNLQEVILNRIDMDECARKYRAKGNTIYFSQMCTWNKGQDACQGDSGSPAIEWKNKAAYAVGLVSYGSTCADDMPGVYTKVSYFIDWILKNIYENSSKEQ
ncbi:unnamed protein product [Medioppia subpectinata]|uniref:Peptidase S1 domain-containing protein n=1 Tax=Medioppia subpectinata TaxID=1979941 RepID=A0A7R9KG06_9ACAR|nr:unnamed protein product [Medioppia subpectinata]CAG2102654.1 unnamed protein product [Medioppia subpectinata]